MGVSGSSALAGSPGQTVPPPVTPLGTAGSRAIEPSPQDPRDPEPSDPEPCPSHEGDFVARSQRDVRRLAELCEVRGNLTVEANGIESLRLPRLQRVTGTLWFRNETLRSLELPRLATVGGALRISHHGGLSGALEALALPVLEHVESDVQVSGETVLRDLHLPALALVGGSLRVTADTRFQLSTLTHLRLPRLRQVLGDLAVEGNSALIELDLSALEEVGVDLTIGRLSVGLEGEMTPRPNPVLQTIALPQLRSVARELGVQLGDALTRIDAPRLEHVGFVTLEHNALLTELSLPALTDCAGALRIAENPGLERVQLGALRACGIVLENNAVLSVLALDALEEAHEIDIRGNRLEAFRLPQLRRVSGAFYLLDPSADVQLPTFTTADSTLLLRGALDIALPALDFVRYLAVSDEVRSFAAPTLRAVESFEIYRSQLTELTLPALTNVGSVVEVTENAGLLAIRLAALTAVGNAPPVWDPTRAWLELRDNPVLAEVALPALESVGGSCTITGSPSLASCDLSDASIGDTLNVPLACE